MRLFGRKASRQAGSVDDDPSFDEQASTLIPAEVRMISGCHSEQTSADVANVNRIASLPDPAGRAGGACTVALLEILYRSEKISFQSLLLELRKSLSTKGMSQIPQLTSSRPLEMKETPFSLCDGPGKRRALLVGINYVGKNGQLCGCHNDILNVQKYLVECQGYSPNHILILMDDGKHIFPTRQKIILGLQQLVQHSKCGDNAYFHYSGHGGLLFPDGFNAFKMNQKQYDETLFPVDHERAGQIRDFSLFHHFVKPMAAGVIVTCVMDCCHSGSVLDLPYSYKPTPGGTIAMHRSLDTMSNLAFLYILAGGVLPMHGFENVTENLESTLEGDLDGYQGVGIEEVQEADFADDAALQQTADYTGWDSGGAEETAGAYPGMIGDDEAAYDNSGNMHNDSGGYGDVAGDSVVRGEDVEQFGASEYQGAFADADAYTSGGQEGAFDASVFGGGGYAVDGAGGDCDCGEGLGEIISSLLDAAGDGE